MGLDLAAVLSAYGAFFDGVGTGWSIGGQQHIGIGGSRGNYETDSSPTRGNLYQYGSNTDLVMSQFKEVSFLPMLTTIRQKLTPSTAFRHAAGPRDC